MSFWFALLSWGYWPVAAGRSVCALSLPEESACKSLLICGVMPSRLAASFTTTSGSSTTNTDCSGKPNMPPTFLAAVTLTVSL